MIKLDTLIVNNQIKMDATLQTKSMIKSMKTNRSIRDASDAIEIEEETKNNSSALSIIQYKINKWLKKFDNKKLTKEKDTVEVKGLSNNGRMSIVEELKYFNPKSNNSNMIAGK